ncbi:hypothetical protein [Methanobrevibacter sp.]|uniref:hypothetical protein n=1 Tax=Methanobrevibacter sp. TaxID=66852 RepID=UPI0026DF11A1|nr:hypothetical protein [Methanobrevibacter sp.]MDO5859241.1 hypothetical protein [Methanobrevibacter sp.]
MLTKVRDLKKNTKVNKDKFVEQILTHPYSNRITNVLMILTSKYCSNTPIQMGELYLTAENIVLVSPYFALARYYIQLGIEIIMT